jgi:hypothetical protein
MDAKSANLDDRSRSLHGPAGLSSHSLTVIYLNGNISIKVYFSKKSRLTSVRYTTISK